MGNTNQRCPHLGNSKEVMRTARHTGIRNNTQDLSLLGWVMGLLAWYLVKIALMG